MGSFNAFFQQYNDYLLIGVVALGLLILFLRDFELNSLTSWLVLLGFLGLGYTLYRLIAGRRELLKQFEQREKKLNKLEQEYEKLKAERQISEERYRGARAELEAARKDFARSIITAEEKLQKALLQNEEEVNNMTGEDLMNWTRNQLENQP
jgi:Skp family chaperone for outer membrane proteins